MINKLFSAVFVAFLVFSGLFGAISASTHDDEPEGWGFINFRSADILVVVKDENPMGEVSPMMLQVAMSVVTDDLERPREVRVKKQYEDMCLAAQGNLDGDHAYIVLCLTEDDMILVMGTNRRVALEAAYETIEDGEPTAPRGYEEYDGGL